MIEMGDNEIRNATVKYKLKFLLDMFKGINYYIAGGCLRDLFSIGHITSDIDVFFPNRKEVAKAIKALRKNKVKCGFHNKQLANFYYKKQKIQIIKSFLYPTVQDIINDFDFTVCSVAYDGKAFYCHDGFFYDLAAKRLMINHVRLPLNTLSRVVKYVKKGYTICNANLLILSKEIAKTDFNNPEQNLFTHYPDGRIKFLSID